MDRVADTVASAQSLRAAFHVPAAALQRPDLIAVADQLARDADPCRPPDDADVHLDLLVAGKLACVRQHLGAPFRSSTMRPGTARTPVTAPVGIEDELAGVQPWHITEHRCSE
jgi:hypothetical protein